jgi:transposase
MFTVELYARIRRAAMVDGLSRREAATRFGVHRNTITKMGQAANTAPERGVKLRVGLRRQRLRRSHRGWQNWRLTADRRESERHAAD